MKPQHLITVVVSLTLIASLTLHAQDATAPQSWTASDGRVMEANFVKLDGESVIVEKDGQQFAVALAKLNAESVALAKRLGGVLPAPAPVKIDAPTFDPAGTDPIKPLWVLGGKEIANPEGPDKSYLVRFLASTSSGDPIFRVGGSEDDPGLAVTRVSNASGKVLWRSPLSDNQEGIYEFDSSQLTMPDGRIIISSVSWREEVSDKSRRARIHLRAVDPVTGKMVAHSMMTFDKPESDAESGPVDWPGQGCVLLRRIDQQVFVAGPYFVAEVDASSLKPVRSTLLPNGDFGHDGGLDANGASWNLRSKGMTLNAQPGGEIDELPPNNSGWWAKVLTQRDQGLEKSGKLVVFSHTAGIKDWAVGAYDLSQKAFAWKKTNADWSSPVSGSTKSLQVITTNDGALIFDTTNGELRYRHAGAKTQVELLPDGKAWVFPEPVEGKPSEILLVNCATGATEAAMTLNKSFDPDPDSRQIIFLPDHRILLAGISGNGGNDDVAEIVVINGTGKTVSPPCKIASGLKSHVSTVSAYATESACVLMVSYSDGRNGGNDDFCAIPLPKK